MKTIHKSKPLKDFSILPNSIAQNNGLTLEARGMLAYLLSLPDDWVIRVEPLKKTIGIGNVVIRRIFKELAEAGHMKLVTLPSDKGSFFQGKRWNVYSDPLERRECGFRTVGTHDTDIQRKIETKKEELKELTRTSRSAPKELTPTLRVGPPLSLESEQSKPPISDVIKESARLFAAPAAAARFFAINERNGWRIKDRPIRNWKIALAAFLKADATAAPVIRPVSETDFLEWAEATYPDDEERIHATSWFDVSKKNGWTTKSAITGEQEPIVNFKKACSAFVDKCIDMKIS